MAIRIRVSVKTRREPVREVATVALVNSGFEADTPQILVPFKLAKELDIYGRLLEARVESYGTPAGPVRMYVLPSSLEVWVAELDVSLRRCRIGYGGASQRLFDWRAGDSG